MEDAIQGLSKYCACSERANSGSLSLAKPLVMSWFFIVPVVESQCLMHKMKPVKCAGALGSTDPGCSILSRSARRTHLAAESHQQA